MNSSKKKSKNFAEYLTNIHSNLIAPEEIINAAVKEATGKFPQNKKRIIAGEANEVYDVTLKNNTHVIIRISRKGKLEFEREKWAIEECKKVDVPVPEILLIKHLKTDKELLSICVQKKLEGDVLERGAIDYHNLDKSYVKRIIVQAGEILSKIHSIKTSGFDYINGKGEGKFKDFNEFAKGKSGRNGEFLKLARKVNFDSKLMEKILETINANLKRCKDLKPFLNNGDFAPKHMRVKGEKITGILDWGEASSNFPVYDFARWDYWFSDELPLEWIKEGYLNKNFFSSEFENNLHWAKLDIGLGVLWWYSSQDYSKAVENAKKKLLRDFRFYK